LISMAKTEKERIGAGGPKTKQAFAQYFASLAGDNSRKMEKNTMKRVVRDGAAFVERKEKQAKKIKLASAKVAAANLSDELECPRETGRERQQIDLLLKGLINN
jgi:hypothetical protein